MFPSIAMSCRQGGLVSLTKNENKIALYSVETKVSDWSTSSVEISIETRFLNLDLDPCPSTSNCKLHQPVGISLQVTSLGIFYAYTIKISACFRNGPWTGRGSKWPTAPHVLYWHLSRTFGHLMLFRNLPLSRHLKGNYPFSLDEKWSVSAVHIWLTSIL
jgi:hypothetical protein